MVRTHLVVSALGALVLSAASYGAVNPFTETFSGPSANWAIASTGPGVAPLTYLPAGGPDGSAYGSGAFGFANAGVNAFPILFRSQDSFDSSGDAFVGDWFAAGVTTMSFAIRHALPTSISVFARFVGTGSPTGVVFQEPVAVLPNVWTTITVPINPGTPFIYEGGPSLFASTFSAMDRLQVGIITNAAIAGQAGPFTIDIDNVSIVPAPGAGALALMAAGAACTVRRRRVRGA